MFVWQKKISGNPLKKHLFAKVKDKQAFKNSHSLDIYAYVGLNLHMLSAWLPDYDPDPEVIFSALSHGYTTLPAHTAKTFYKSDSDLISDLKY